MSNGHLPEPKYSLIPHLSPTNFLKMENHKNSPRQDSLTFLGIKCIARLAFVFGALLLICNTMIGQSYTKVDIKLYGFSLQVPDVTLMKGETVEATLIVGNAGNPVRNAVGFDLAIELAPGARFASSLAPSMNGSWLAEPNKTVSESRNLDTPQRYQYAFKRANAVVNGGMLMRVTIVADLDYVHSTELIRNAAGVMQIDNLDLKQAGPEQFDAANHGDQELKVWPNPATGDAKSAIHLQIANHQVADVAIMNLEGRVLANATAVSALDMSAYPAGTYLLQITDPSGQTYYRRQNLF